jgi:hypothetical protein
MRKKYSSILAAIFIAAVLSFLYFTMMPQWTSLTMYPFGVSTKTYATVKPFQKPHFVGSENHELVANYLIKEQNRLETSFRRYIATGNLSKIKNILARIKGTTTQSLLLSHYDSAPFYSHGASDAGSVATILEYVPFAQQNTSLKTTSSFCFQMPKW